MSPLPRIHAATPMATLREPVIAEGGPASPASGFAEVIRAVFKPVYPVHPVHAPTPARHAPSALSHTQAPANKVRAQSSMETNSSSAVQSATTNKSATGNDDSTSQIPMDTHDENQIAGPSGIQNSATPPAVTTGSGSASNAATASQKEGGAVNSGTVVSDGQARSKDSIQATGSAPSKEAQPANTTNTQGPSAAAGAVSVTTGIVVPAPVASAGSAGSDGSASKKSAAGTLADVPGALQAGAVNTQKNATSGTVAGDTEQQIPGVPDAVNVSKHGMLGSEPAGSTKPGTMLPDAVRTSRQEIPSGVNPGLGSIKAGPEPIKDARQATSSGSSASSISQPSTNQNSTNLNVGPAMNQAGSQASPGNGSSSTQDAANGAANATNATNGNTPGNPNPANASGTGSSTAAPDNGNSKGLPSQTAPGAAHGSGSPVPLTALPGAKVPNGSAVDPAFSLHSGQDISALSSHANSVANPVASNGLPGAGRGTPSAAFMALDNAQAMPHGTLLQTAPHQVSMGIADPALGWVEVRADRIAGQVTASLTADSAASHTALISVLPAMANYLHEQHSVVQQVHVETGLAGGQGSTGGQGQPNSQHGAHTPAGQSAIPAGGGVRLAPPQPLSGAHSSHAPAARSPNAGHQVSVRA